MRSRSKNGRQPSEGDPRSQPFGVKEDQKATVRALGFKKTGDTRDLKDTPDVQGMVSKISYLLKIEG